MVRQVKFFYTHVNYQSTVDKLYFDTLKSGTMQFLNVLWKNTVLKQNEETAAPLTTEHSMGNDATEPKPIASFSDMVLVRIVKEGLGTAEKPIMISIPDNDLKSGGMEYTLRTGDILTLKASQAKTLVGRGIAVIANIDVEGI
jgi:hypothetical protein